MGKACRGMQPRMLAVLWCCCGAACGFSLTAVSSFLSPSCIGRLLSDSTLRSRGHLTNYGALTSAAVFASLLSSSVGATALGGHTSRSIHSSRKVTAVSSTAALSTDNCVRGTAASPFRTTPLVVFVLGGPGSGKGTQSTLLAKELDYVHLSAGELLREERASGSSDGQLIDKYIDEGKIVPVALSLGLLRKAMQSCGRTRFLIDGFPRNADNLEGWTAMMGECTRTTCVLCLDCAESVLEKRLLKRGETEGRSDDNLVTARKRFTTYVETTLPVVQHYEKLGLLCRVNADQTIEEVLADIKQGLKRFITDEIVATDEELRSAVNANDWDTYRHLCAPGVSVFAKGVNHDDQGNVKALFEAERRLSSLEENMHYSSKPSIHLMEKSAVATLVRSSGVKESRVWQLEGGDWKLAHCHFS